MSFVKKDLSKEKDKNLSDVLSLTTIQFNNALPLMKELEETWERNELETKNRKPERSDTQQKSHAQREMGGGSHWGTVGSSKKWASSPSDDTENKELVHRQEGTSREIY